MVLNISLEKKKTRTSALEIAITSPCKSTWLRLCRNDRWAWSSGSWSKGNGILNKLILFSLRACADPLMPSSIAPYAGRLSKEPHWVTLEAFSTCPLLSPVWKSIKLSRCAFYVKRNYRFKFKHYGFMTPLAIFNKEIDSCTDIKNCFCKSRRV